MLATLPLTQVIVCPNTTFDNFFYSVEFHEEKLECNIHYKREKEMLRKKQVLPL